MQATPPPLPPETPWWVAVLVLALPGIAALVVGILGALKGRRGKHVSVALVDDKWQARVDALEARLKEIDGLERADVARLREDVNAIGEDLSRLRAEVDADTKDSRTRRERARTLAERDRRALDARLNEMAEKLAEISGTLKGMRHGS